MWSSFRGRARLALVAGLLVVAVYAAYQRARADQPTLGESAPVAEKAQQAATEPSPHSAKPPQQLDRADQPGTAEKSAQVISPPPKSARGEVSPEFEEILRIRREQGRLLQGTILDDGRGDDELFAEGLRQAESAQNQLGPPLSTPQSADVPPALPPISDLIRGSDVVTTLRQCARSLDQQANDLEDEERFEAADELRRVAQVVRIQARALRPDRNASR